MMLARTFRPFHCSSRYSNHPCRRSFSDSNYGFSEVLKPFDLNDTAQCNVTVNIASKVGMNLHRKPLHPLHILNQKIRSYWGDSFQVFDDISPVCSTHASFDQLRIPAEHVSRDTSDTYYLDTDTVLRPHTSAHQVELLSQGHDRFLVSGDVYRRDEIDRSHYPVFHQMEGVKIFKSFESENPDDHVMEMKKDLQAELEGLATHLFGEVGMRWEADHFPFTHPSYELEIFYDDEWMEVLGCGVIHPEIMENAGRPGEKGWAFGLGLERLAMVLFNIPDIRLFWSEDERFHRQFASGDIVEFKPYSKYPPCTKDISFWLSNEFCSNDLNEIVRDVAGDLVEQVDLMDEFLNRKTMRYSHCYRITYRSMDRSLTNEEVDELQEEVRHQVVAFLGVELR